MNVYYAWTMSHETYGLQFGLYMPEGLMPSDDQMTIVADQLGRQVHRALKRKQIYVYFMLGVLCGSFALESVHMLIALAMVLR